MKEVFKKWIRYYFCLLYSYMWYFTVNILNILEIITAEIIVCHLSSPEHNSILFSRMIWFNMRTVLNETAGQQWRQLGRQSANSCQQSQLFEDVCRSHTSGQPASGRTSLAMYFLRPCARLVHRPSPTLSWSTDERGTRGYCYCLFSIPILLSRGLTIGSKLSLLNLCQEEIRIYLLRINLNNFEPIKLLFFFFQNYTL